MSGFSRLLEAGRVTDDELFKHLIFFEKQIGISSSVGLEDIWSRNADRERIKQELLNRQLINKRRLEVLSSALMNLDGEKKQNTGFLLRKGGEI